MEKYSPLHALSPLDGRYKDQVKDLRSIFSEAGLMKYRLLVEIEYLIVLGDEVGIEEVIKFSDKDKEKLRQVYEKFDLKDAQEVKKIEKITDHDVKSIEYFIKQKLAKSDFKETLEFVHFALTSEDVNNLSYSLMWQAGLQAYYKSLKKLLKELKQQAIDNKRLALLSLTHGQPATPTTLGKELAVFYWRLKQALTELEEMGLQAKFSGASGGWNAQVVAYPKLDWLKFSQSFIEHLGLGFNPLTTQIEPHDTLASSFDALNRINVVLVDLCQDMWLYISRGIFKQQAIGTVGSSTMPHKVNPIKFENAESNASLASTILNHLSEHLPISRMQRDLRDSTLIRNQGIALGYSLQAVKYTLVGLSKVAPDKLQLKQELDEHWEVLAEPIQVVLRKVGYTQPYEALKKLTRGKVVDKERVQKFVKALDIPKTEKIKLLKLTPHNYVGLASKLVDKYLV
jgi:adenylosuccinate lyase